MDSEFWIMLLKIIVFLPFILILIYISLKYGGERLQNLQNGKFIKVLERTALTKENTLLVAKIGNKGYVLSSANGKVEILLEISDEELKALEKNFTINQFSNFKDISNSKRIKDFCIKLKCKKEDKDE